LVTNLQDICSKSSSSDGLNQCLDRNLNENKNAIDQDNNNDKNIIINQDNEEDNDNIDQDDDDEDEDDDDSDDEEAEMKQVSVTFVNSRAGSVSLFWEDETGMGTLISKSLASAESQSINTFVGHIFFFTVEGTRSRIGDYITIEDGKNVYELSADAQVVEELSDDACSDRYPRRCQRDKELGHCDNFPGWMTVNCPKACNRCELLDPRKRCTRAFLNTTQEPWMKPGDLNKLFEDMAERTKQYDPVIVSSPPEGPWVIYFDNFLSDIEADTLIEWGNKIGFERSTDTGPLNSRGEAQKIVSKTRTSENAWCSNECVEDPIVQGVTKRIEEIIKTPSSYYEDYQLLRYTEGQYYKVHHDMSENEEMEFGGGPRTLTFFLYLSDVEEGGETHFPRLKLKVAPKKGRAVLWPSVLDENSYKQDRRTHHESLPVKKGIKYAANHWIHSNDYKIANLWGCNGAFD